MAAAAPASRLKGSSNVGLTVSVGRFYYSGRCFSLISDDLVNDSDDGSRRRVDWGRNGDAAAAAAAAERRRAERLLATVPTSILLVTLQSGEDEQIITGQNNDVLVKIIQNCIS